MTTLKFHLKGLVNIWSSPKLSSLPSESQRLSTDTCVTSTDHFVLGITKLPKSPSWFCCNWQSKENDCGLLGAIWNVLRRHWISSWYTCHWLLGLGVTHSVEFSLMKRLQFIDCNKQKTLKTNKFGVYLYSITIKILKKQFSGKIMYPSTCQLGVIVLNFVIKPFFPRNLLPEHIGIA